jgi:hypothetical protein
MHCVEGTSKKYALDRLALPTLWLVQEGANLTQIEVLAFEKAGFLLSKKPRCPLVNLVGVDIFAPVKQPFGCAPQNLFGDGTSALVYKPLDLDAWPKSRNGRKIRHPDTFKLSILQKNKWEVGQTFEVTLLTPLNIPPSRYGWIYCLFLGLPENYKQYEVTINDYLVCSCMDFISMMVSSLGK